MTVLHDLHRDANLLMAARGIPPSPFILHRAFSRTISTYLVQTASRALPLFMGGGLQWVNEVAFLFHHVRPPEELALNYAKASAAEELSAR